MTLDHNSLSEAGVGYAMGELQEIADTGQAMALFSLPCTAGSPGLRLADGEAKNEHMELHEKMLSNARATAH